MMILDISIPADTENAEDIYIDLIENYEPVSRGFGFGFYDAQIECDDKNMASTIVKEIKQKYKIKFEYSVYIEKEV